MASRPKKALPTRIWADALRKAALEYAEGKKGPRRLDLAAKAVVKRISEGDMSAIREFGERIDGKVPQPIIGGSKDDPPVALQLIELRGVVPK